MVFRSPKLGIVVRQAAEVRPNPVTGQLETRVRNIPQLPFSRFRLRFREGGRSPLITPPTCGIYETKAVFTPWANPSSTYETTASFQIDSGVGAVLRPRPGHANIERTIVRLPRSAFLDQAHIRTICTRVQFAADSCPKGAIYGHVAAFTPLLDEPLRGPAYLRSSTNKLPDLVFDLHGTVDVEVSARIDSIRGGIRAIFNGIPDAPLSKVVVRMQGGNKGLIVNSRNLCRGKNRANVRLDAHSGGQVRLRPLLRPQHCKKRKRAKRSNHRALRAG